MRKIEELLKRIKPCLPTFSYSRLEVFKNCPLQYKYKYIDKKYSDDTTIALEVGNLCHYVLEQKGKMITDKQNVNYDLLNKILLEGTDKVDKKTKEVILGVTQLQKKYFDKWYESDNASGMSYEEKIKMFDTVLHEEMENNDGWMPVCFEMPFEFIWDDRIVIRGFIDRVDIKDGSYKAVDYKTSKKKYDDKLLPTSLQFGIYALAILNKFKVLPQESEYRFILINETQYALTKGWEKRLIKALDKILNAIESCEKKNIFLPKPSPLCHWCNFCQTNPDATIYRNECEYFSKWTPTNKTFELNRKWDALDTNQHKRKLVF